MTKQLPTARKPFASTQNPPKPITTAVDRIRESVNTTRPLLTARKLFVQPKTCRAAELKPRTSANLMKGNLDKALADYTEAIRLDPKLAEVYCRRGLAYSVKGEHDKAIADRTEALRSIRSSPRLTMPGATVLGVKGEFDRVIADCNVAIQLDPKYANAYCNRGMAYRVKGECDKAIADFTTRHPTQSKRCRGYSQPWHCLPQNGRQSQSGRRFRPGQKAWLQGPVKTPFSTAGNRHRAA